jgi:hypothetical protein
MTTGPGYTVDRWFAPVEGACLWAYPWSYRRRMVLTPIHVFDGVQKAVVLGYADGVVVVSTHPAPTVPAGGGFGVLG